MTSLLPSCGLLSLTFAAMLCLCRASLHQPREVARSERVRRRQRKLRTGGWLLLALSAVLSGHFHAWDIGWAFWLGSISVVSLFLVGLATYRPHWLEPALPLSLAAGLAISGWSLLFSLGST